MSFFTKIGRDTNRFFTKTAKPLVANFFRKGGGLDGLNTGLRQSSKIVGGIGGGIKNISQSPIVLAGGTVLGSYVGNPLLGSQIQQGGMALGEGLEGTSTLLGAGKTITNRNKYLSEKQQADEQAGIDRRNNRREFNELERQLPSIPKTPPRMKNQYVPPVEPIYSVPSVQPYTPPVHFSFT